MKVISGAQLAEAGAFFEVLHTTDKSQVAVMNLAAGQASGEMGSDHPHADQILIVLEGGGRLKIGDEERDLRPGDVAVIPAGAPHQVFGPSKSLSIYAPPGYPEQA